eukprot:SAG31_NODE_4584_length_3117_cov_1.583830_3_plen_346_part_00
MGNKTGAAIWLDSPDHSVTNTVISCCGQGLVTSAASSVITALHVYTEGELTGPNCEGSPDDCTTYSYPNGCVHVQSTSVRMLGCYFDGCPVFVDGGSDIEIADSLFLLPPGHAHGYNSVVLTPVSKSASLEGLRIINNLGIGSVPTAEYWSFVVLNESESKYFDHQWLTNVNVFGNQWPGKSGLRATKASAVVTAAHTNTFEANLSDILLFDKQVSIPSVQYSLEVNDSAHTFARHTLVASARPGIITVRSEFPLDHATLRVSVDQSRMQQKPPTPAGPPWCGNATGDLPCTEVFDNRLCEDQGSLIGAGSKLCTVAACFEWCKADPACSFFVSSIRFTCTLRYW